MERSTPVRKPHTSTADLLTWSENPDVESPAAAASRSVVRNHQPSDGIRKVVFGGQVTDEEVESLIKRKPCSGHKMKEMTGSGIFAANEDAETAEPGAAATPNSKTGLRMYQQAVSGMSQISFGEDEGVSPKKPTTLTEVAKQRELSGTIDSDSDANLKKHLSDAKCKELSGHDIFAPPPEILPRKVVPLSLNLGDINDEEEPAKLSVWSSVGIFNRPAQGQNNVMPSEGTVMKTAKKIYNQKFSELTGNNIFKGDAPPPAEKPLSGAKLREMSGSNIFADGKAESRDYHGGVRKPPGGESSIALV